MKKGFTLLELIIVIIILGVLATLGFTQYGRMIEKSRGAEAKAILGDIRKLAAAHYMEYGSLDGTPIFNNTRANIGTALDQIPNNCRSSHYFGYHVTAVAPTTVTIIATRCTSGGKTPDGPAGNLTLNLVPDMSSGVDTWGGTANY